MADINDADNATWNQTLGNQLYIEQANEGDLNVNSSNYWDDYDTANTTQIENNGGILNIMVSWFNQAFDTQLGTKTSDDITEGSTNLYDNQTWNQTLGDELYGGSNATFNQSLTDDLYILQSEEGNLNVNSSVYWNDSISQYNVTQISNEGGILNILVS